MSILKTAGTFVACLHLCLALGLLFWQSGADGVYQRASLILNLLQPPRQETLHTAEVLRTVERTIGWIQHYRRLCIRWEKSTTLFQGSLHLGCPMLLLKEVLG